MKHATYIGLQENIDRPPLVLVNVKEDYGITTVTYKPDKHILKSSDRLKILDDQRKYYEVRSCKK